mmetsp:Transcript_53566/g.158567  ORF Transcript_53566/g.158567 Transcript_53566/m.158567 type:complete len:157 (+) Transcript_53566:915-1385(+)
MAQRLYAAAAAGGGDGGGGGDFVQGLVQGVKSILPFGDTQPVYRSSAGEKEQPAEGGGGAGGVWAAADEWWRAHGLLGGLLSDSSAKPARQTDDDGDCSDEDEGVAVYRCARDVGEEDEPDDGDGAFAPPPLRRQPCVRPAVPGMRGGGGGENGQA